MLFCRRTYLCIYVPQLFLERIFVALRVQVHQKILRVHVPRRRYEHPEQPLDPFENADVLVEILAQPLIVKLVVVGPVISDTGLLLPPTEYALAAPFNGITDVLLRGLFFVPLPENRVPAKVLRAAEAGELRVVRKSLADVVELLPYLVLHLFVNSAVLVKLVEQTVEVAALDVVVYFVLHFLLNVVVVHLQEREDV